MNLAVKITACAIVVTLTVAPIAECKGAILSTERRIGDGDLMLSGSITVLSRHIQVASSINVKPDGSVLQFAGMNPSEVSPPADRDALSDFAKAFIAELESFDAFDGIDLQPSVAGDNGDTNLDESGLTFEGYPDDLVRKIVAHDFES